MGIASLNLCFFWHMHQPDYRGSDGVMRMPWVFLHAIKDYYEMPWLLSQYRGLKATFNLTPSLIEQLQLYREPLKYDYFLTLWIKHPSTLTITERKWLIKLITAMQYETMVLPLERYAGLYYQSTFSDEELIDLEVLFLLAWCGSYLRMNNTLVKALLLQKEGYTQEDKRGLLETLSYFTQEILPFYKELQEKEIISVSTTPYFHPIVPLLLDMENARHANVTTDLPDGVCSLLPDAIEHVARSIALYKATFGRKPNGFWPAEGAVDEKSVAIYKEYAIKWIATDEAILYKSLGHDESSLRYKPYNFKGVTIAFRDHALSDRIGFEYRHCEGREASDSFMNELQQIASREKNPTVFVIVDGENAWEFYPNNGLDFFHTLYTALSSSEWCSSLTLDTAASLKEVGVLEHLSPGSWIQGTFDTWVGHPEKNRAWELIHQTRCDIENYGGALGDEVKEEILHHILASECSDWFWWYGEDHNTDFAIEFDALFREHLIHIYKLLGRPIPSNLLEPIISDISPQPFWIKPSNTISPLLDGKKSSFFEWMGCGVIDERKMFSTMDRVRGPIDLLYYGFDKKWVYFALEGNVTVFKNVQIEVEIQESGDRVVIEPVRLEERLEFSLSREYFQGSSSVHLRVVLNDENKNSQSLPGFGFLYLDLDNHFSTDWFI